MGGFNGTNAKNQSRPLYVPDKGARIETHKIMNVPTVPIALNKISGLNNFSHKSRPDTISKIGLLINFTHPKAQIKRLIL